MFSVWTTHEVALVGERPLLACSSLFLSEGANARPIVNADDIVGRGPEVHQGTLASRIQELLLVPERVGDVLAFSVQTIIDVGVLSG